MTHPHLFVDGKPVPIGKRIGKGGEGEVFIVANDATRAIKVYTGPDSPAREAKIGAMIEKGFAQKTPLVAFPIAIARDQNGRFKGFVMNFVRDHKPVFDLYAPHARKQQFPGADYRFLVRAALNTAKAIADVHKKSECVIGDINHSGILVSNDARVALIDADSFQLIDGARRYLCRVGVPEYTPPELQGIRLGDVVRTENHDAFGLAIALFLLLGMGRHPFVGAYAKGDMPLPQAISEFRFAYSRRPHVDMTPPPAVCTLDDFSVPVAQAFEAAFGPAGTKSRPSAGQWIALLDEFERSLRKCGKNALHYYSSAAPSCPWCRMEQKLRMILFLPKDIGIIIPGPDTDDFNLPLLWAQIEAIRAPTRNELVPAFSSLTPAPSAEAVANKNQGLQPSLIRAGGIVAGIVILAAVPTLWFLALGAVWIAFSLASSKTDVSATWRQRFLEIEEEWNRALDQWERRSGFEKIENLRTSLVEAKRAYEALAHEQADRIRRSQDERESLQRAAFLERFRIRDYKISQVGPAKLAALTSYGIETAADITPESVLAVAGFGPINSKPLSNGNNNARAALFTIRSQPPRTSWQSIQSRPTSSSGGKRFGRNFSRKPNSLARTCRPARPCSNKATLRLRPFTRGRAQIEADLTYLGIPLPPRPSRPAPQRPTPRSAPTTVHTPTGAQTVRSPTGATTPTCPKCHRPMVRRLAHRGSRAGKPFWGCSRYPRCTGTRPI